MDNDRVLEAISQRRVTALLMFSAAVRPSSGHMFPAYSRRRLGI
jgi:hypothetical protein